MKKLEEYRKFIVALIANASAVYAVIDKADLSTKQGVYAALIGLYAALAVCVAPNGPTKPTSPSDPSA